WLVIPVLAARWLRAKDVQEEKPGAIARSTYSGYRSLMSRMLAHPWLVLLILLPILWLGYLQYQRAETGVMPSIDEGGFVLDYIGPAGASLTETDRLLRQVEAVLKNTPEVQTYSRRTGFSLGGDIQETNMGDFYVRLKPLPRRSLDDVTEDIRKQIEHTI